MPRQRQLPHTAPAPGPCDRELEAWLDAREEASDSAAGKKRKYTELLDAMIEAGVSRIPYVDPATNKRKWLAVRSEAKLVSAKAEVQEASGTEAKRTAVRTPKTADPFGSTRAGMAVDGPEFTPDESGAEDRTGGPVNGNAATEQLAQESDSDITGDLRTPAQQRKRGAR